MFWQDRGVTSSQVPTQTQRSNDTPTVRIQPVAATPEPAWPTAEPMTATNIPPVPASGVAFEPETPPTNGHLPLGPPNSALNGTLNGAANGVPAGNGTLNGAVNGVPAVLGAPAVPGAPAQAAAAEPAAGPTPDPAPAPAPAATAATAPAPAPAKPAEPAKPRSRLRRIARRIVGPSLLTKKG